MIIIPGEFTTLNQYIDKERGNRFAAAKIKKDETERAMYAMRGCEAARIYPVRIMFSWYTADLRTDTDNISFAQKFILDAMVKAGILENDSRRFVIGDH